MKRVLMCRPESFDVLYNINHWMNDQIGNVNKEKAIKQWYTLFNAISRIAIVNLIDDHKEVPDLVFTANAGLIHDDLAILSKFSTKERQPEEAVFHEWFSKKGYTVFQPSVSYEGEGDHLRDEFGRHWMGSGFRTRKEAAKEITNFLNVHINVLELVDPRWYHLDTCFCPLPGNRIMYYPGAFSEESQKLIRNSFDVIIEVSEEDGNLFCCNCVVIDKTLFLPNNNHASAMLSKQGFNTREFELSEFLKSGGAAKCLVLDCNYVSGEGSHVTL